MSQHNQSEMIAITSKEAPVLLKDILLAGLVPNLSGSPGIGKSDIIRTVADDLNLKVIDFRLAQADPTDLNGFPTLNEDRTRSHYAPPAVFPLATDAKPEGKDGWLVFFDEMPSASKSVQVAAYKILLDRMIGEHDIHPDVHMICAGNLATDKAVVNRLSTALQSRLIHLTLKVNDKDWLDWADENDIDFRVKAYIAFRPDYLHKFNPSHADETFPCPRTWAFMSKLIKPWDTIGHDKLPALAGTIGQGTAREFKVFTDIFDSLPTRQEILNTPDTMAIPSRPDVMYALVGLIGNMAEATNMPKLIKLIDRLPLEFQVIAMQTIAKSSPALGTHATVRDWMVKNMDKLA